MLKKSQDSRACVLRMDMLKPVGGDTKKVKIMSKIGMRKINHKDTKLLL
jgi:hypothetical protein